MILIGLEGAIIKSSSRIPVPGGLVTVKRSFEISASCSGILIWERNARPTRISLSPLKISDHFPTDSFSIRKRKGALDVHRSAKNESWPSALIASAISSTTEASLPAICKHCSPDLACLLSIKTVPFESAHVPTEVSSAVNPPCGQSSKPVPFASAKPCRWIARTSFGNEGFSLGFSRTACLQTKLPNERESSSHSCRVSFIV